MVIEAVLFFIVVLVVVYPVWQQRREDALAKQLERAHDQHEAAALVEGALRQSSREGRFLETVRDHINPSLFR